MSLMSEKDKWSIADRNIIVVLIHLFKYMSKYSIQARPLLIDALPGDMVGTRSDRPTYQLRDKTGLTFKFKS